MPRNGRSQPLQPPSRLLAVKRRFSKSEARRKPDYIREIPFMRQIIGLAKSLGWGYWHDNATNFPRACRQCKAPILFARNRRGFPDLLLIRDDTLLFVEIKPDDGTRSEDQVAWADALVRVKKVSYAVWRPSDVERIIRTLTRTE